MLDKKLELGATIYYVQEENNANRRKRIFMTDESGQEWSRYDMPSRTHTLTEYTIVGRVLKILEGNVPDREDHQDVYILSSGEEIAESELLDDAYGWRFFTNKDEALEWIERRKVLASTAEH